MYAGIRDLTIVETVRSMAGGQLPTPPERAPGPARTAARAALDRTADGEFGGGGIITANSGSGPLPELARAGLAYTGVPYRWGGTDPATGLDCSGLVQCAFRDIGISSPRNTTSQQVWSALRTVPSASAAAGDLAFWPGHVAIVIGPGEVVHSPRPGRVVTRAPLAQAGPRGTPMTIKRYAGPRSPARTAAA